MSSNIDVLKNLSLWREKGSLQKNFSTMCAASFSYCSNVHLAKMRPVLKQCAIIQYDHNKTNDLSWSRLNYSCITAKLNGL